MSWLFGKKKLKLKKKKKVEEPVLESIGEDNLDLNDGELLEIAEEVRVKKKKPIINVKAPQGKAFVNNSKRSYFQLVLGTLFMFINVLFVIGALYPSFGLDNNMKGLILLYAMPSIYICYSFGWIKMQVEDVDEQLE